MQRTTRPPAERFWAKVNKNGPLPTEGTAIGQCWIWTGAMSNHGYGTFNAGSGRYVSTHRYAYELTYGPIPDGLVGDHLCRRHECCRPSHIQAVSNAENLRRGKHHSDNEECLNGHKYTEANTGYRPSGTRFCRECRRATNRRYRRGETGRRERSEGQCKNGHTLDATNAYERADRPGAIECRACARDRRKAYSERYRAAQANVTNPNRTYTKAA